MGELHIYVLEEGGCATHWCVATSADEARRLVLDTACVDEPDELDVVEVIPDEEPHTVTFIDGFDYPDRWESEVPPGATVEAPNGMDGGFVRVTAPAAAWARLAGRPCYSGSSEF